jgi:hypothetical protein
MAKLDEITKKLEAKNKQNKEKAKANIEFLKNNKDKFRWIFGVIFALVGISSFGDSIFGGLLYILLGLFLLPPISSLLAKNDKLKFSQNNFVWYSIVLLLLIGSGNIVSSGKTEKVKSEFTANSASIIADIQKDLDAKNFSSASSKLSKYIDALPANEDLKKLKAALDEKKKEKTNDVASTSESKASTTSKDYFNSNIAGIKDNYCAGYVQRASGLITQNSGGYTGEALDQLQQVAKHLANNGDVLLMKAMQASDAPSNELLDALNTGMDNVGNDITKNGKIDLTILLDKSSQVNNKVMTCLRRNNP